MFPEIPYIRFMAFASTFSLGLVLGSLSDQPTVEDSPEPPVITVREARKPEPQTPRHCVEKKRDLYPSRTLELTLEKARLESTLAIGPDRPEAERRSDRKRLSEVTKQLDALRSFMEMIIVTITVRPHQVECTRCCIKKTVTNCEIKRWHWPGN